MARTKTTASDTLSKKAPRKTSILAKPAKKSKLASQHPGIAGIKKPHRFRPGTLANMEIRRYQSSKSPELLAQKAPMVRLIREIMHDIHPDLRITAECIYALRVAYEAEANRLFQSANRMAQHGSRITVMPKDFDAVVDLRDIYPDECAKQQYRSERYLKERVARIEKASARIAHKKATLKEPVGKISKKDTVVDDEEEEAEISQQY